MFSVHHRESVTCLYLSSQTAREERPGAAIVGLFSDHSGQQQAITIPVARKKLLHLIERKHLVAGSHLHKELLDFLDGLPKFELFRLTDEALSEMCDTVLSLIDQPRLEIHVMAAELPEALRILICVPGEQPDYAALRRARRLIESSLGCEACARFTVSLKTFTVHSLYFFPEPPAGWSPASMEQIVEGLLEELQPRLQRLLTRWRAATGSLLSDDVALAVLDGLPDDYLVAHLDLEVLLDLGRIAELLTRGEPQFALRRGRDGGAVMVLYDTVKHSLSRIMPVLTNMRLQVDDVQTYAVTLPESAISLQTFELVSQAGKSLTPEVFSRPMKELVLGVLEGRLENDPLNGLLVACGLGWREINLTMLLRDYLMQDRSVLGRGNALLELAHVRGEGRLVADGRGDAPEQGGHLGARLGEAEDVVDEEQDVLTLFVAEVLGHGERRQADARSRPGRLVHLAEHERGLVENGLTVRRLGLHHLVPEVVALAGALANAAENRVARVLLRDVADELENHDGLAHAGAAEQSDLAALRVRCDQVHHLDAGLEGLDARRLFDEGRSGPVDGQRLLALDRSALVDRFADHVHDAPERPGAHRDADHVPGVSGRLAPDETVGGIHGDAAHGVLAQVLGDLEHQVALAIVDAGVAHAQRGKDLRQLAGREHHVHHRPHHLQDLAVFIRHLGFLPT